MREGLPIALVFLTLLPSCATAPGTYAFERSLPYGHPYPDVWAAAVEVATADLPVSAIHANGGVGTITTLEHELSSSDGHHDCGSGRLEYTYGDHLASVSMVVRELDDGGATVTVNTRFSALRFLGWHSRGSEGSRVTCSSTGTLEADLQRRVRETLERAG
ncbi:MAG: hypothetical protein F4020_04130 [Gammaproteobacteria bacterium]|nr:hypothetical protein [Gammaproteobacteria bacterium]